MKVQFIESPVPSCNQVIGGIFKLCIEGEFLMINSDPFSSFSERQTAQPSQRLVPQNDLSYVRGDTAIGLEYITISTLLARTVEQFGAQPAVVFREQSIRWTWHDLNHKVDELAAALLSLGITQSDRVGIWSPNRFEWLITQFATARIGAVLVNINPAYRLSELEYALNKVQMKALITAEAFKSSNYIQMLRTLAPELDECEAGKLNSAKLPHLKILIKTGATASPGFYTYDEVLALKGSAQTARLLAISQALSPDDAINIQFTSGTTGHPKGATLSHHNIVNNAISVARAMRLTRHDKLCIPVPLYHCFGMVLGVLACVSSGATMVFPSEAFDPLLTLDTVSKEGCTALHGVPTMFIAMLDHAEFARFDLKTLRTGIMAGAPCPIETMKKVVSAMYMKEVTIAYGMTETSPVSFQSETDDPLDKRVSTVGRILPHLEVKIVNEAGHTVKVNEKGELCTRGYSVMKGYWNDAEKTAETIREGWMHTGDLAVIDELGYCNIVGRVKDMIIRGGENVYPREIEEFLFRHPAVKEVQAFGVPDKKYGEELAVWIVTKPNQLVTQEAIIDFCKGQIAHFKIPRYVKFVDEMPMTVTGKPQKFIMRKLMMADLGLEEQITA
jgi:fatty-acyl-CoA synthase